LFRATRCTHCQRLGDELPCGAPAASHYGKCEGGEHGNAERAASLAEPALYQRDKGGVRPFGFALDDRSDVLRRGPGRVEQERTADPDCVTELRAVPSWTQAGSTRARLGVSWSSRQLAAGTVWPTRENPAGSIYKKDQSWRDGMMGLALVPLSCSKLGSDPPVNGLLYVSNTAPLISPISQNGDQKVA
jgi:hypothetical protein